MIGRYTNQGAVQNSLVDVVLHGLKNDSFLVRVEPEDEKYGRGDSPSKYQRIIDTR